ncbi:MAG: type VI secretion system tip protein TssI/VgrG [Desulfuromonadaceae bacterium]|nr:type VI secretion system tip protein TssI/VgrG [Desulfuromonadaceae bacterium]MDD2849188.1 type VI secretion system tip protein TssI/VgrG [Desulfuromonadaceae bacterium]MDD4129763.1 type VI secretion system tip protein TssI/VgrG [Desulfuromonadaceae bacterium]
MPANSALFTFKLLDLEYDLSVLEVNASENVSHMSGATLILVSEEVIPCGEVIRQEGTLTIINPEGPGNPDRYFHGIVRKFRHREKKGRFNIYEAELVPSLWLLTLKQNCRIFQDTKLQDIIGKILQESGITSDFYEFRLHKQDIFNKFNVQYNETDLHFISRLLEKEGIFYFFEHYEDKHVLVFCDTDAYYQNIGGDTSIPFNSGGLASANKINISSFDYSDRIRPGVLTHANYNFKTPSMKLETDFKSEYNNTDEPFEVYTYPGSYGKTDRGDYLAQIRMETMAALKEKGRGISNCARLTSGATFQLTEHNNQEFNQEYFLFGVTHKGLQPDVLKELAPKDIVPGYRNIFMVIPSSVTYRPEQRHEKPMVPGLLSAIVTGPKGEEIWPDEYGRVNVQFHFDREGKMDEKSSCWLRTMQFWNGGSYGSQFIPRVGDEVLVSFINGDMDYPIITGSVVNEAKQPNYTLPANKTQSGIKTRSSPGGTAANFNELRFEDKMGSEEVYLQSEKDWNILIKNDKGQRVGHDETLTVGNDRSKYVVMNQSESIGVNKSIQVGVNHTETIGANMTLTVGSCQTETVGINSMETIGAAKELSIGGLYQISVGGIMNETVAGAKTEEVGLAKAVFVGATMAENVVGSRTTNIGADLTETISGKYYSKANEYVIEAPKITFKAGSSTITMDGSSITIKASKVFSN